MVSGHLQVKKGFYYVVLSYYNNNGKRRVKYFSTGLPEKGNKRKAEAELGEFNATGLSDKLFPPVYSKARL